jgi:hypothetical protein
MLDGLIPVPPNSEAWRESVRANVVYPVEKVARSKSSRTRAPTGRLSDGSAVTNMLFHTSPNPTWVLTLAGLRESKYGIHAEEVLN